MNRTIRVPGRNVTIGDTVAKLNPQLFNTDSQQAQAMEMNRRLQLRPSTDEGKLNQNEKLYLEFLRGSQPQWYGIQAITLKLGHDTRFTPDFWALDDNGLRAIDVKATWSNGKVHIEDDAMVKLKIAARLFPFIHFLIAWREGTIWQHRPIKP